MLNNLKARRDELLGKKQDGFTIVEVMIVLAIAGLIILIVFLEVPALQRQSRNTQRVNDISALGSSLNNYLTSRNGETTSISSAAITDNAKLGIYDAGKVTVATQATAKVVADPGDLEKVSIMNYATCETAGTASRTTNATKRSWVAMYRIEDASAAGFVLQCKEL